MAAIDSTKKSSRLLQSRRYTHDTYTDAQEAFTSTLDINANEVYVDQSLIPSSSLPYSGSGQNGSTYSVNGQNVVKYWYRQPMTKSDLNNEVWFFLDPQGAAGGIGAQIIDATQLTNFISPKYSVPALANANTEDATPGYGVKVIVAGTQVSVNNYSFDYKTGVLQFASSAVAPTNGQSVTITAYQYVGRVLTNSITTFSSSIAALSASIGGGGGASLGSRVQSLEAKTGSYATTGSNQFNGDQSVSGSVTVNTFVQTTTLQGTGSIYLKPDVNDGRQIEIYNTAPSDIHIKGINTAYTYLGDDTNYVLIDTNADTVSITGQNGVYVGGIVETIGAFSQSVDSRLDSVEEALGGGGTIADIFKATGSVYATTNDIQITGSLIVTNTISGSFYGDGSNLTGIVVDDGLPNNNWDFNIDDTTPINDFQTASLVYLIDFNNLPLAGTEAGKIGWFGDLTGQTQLIPTTNGLYILANDQTSGYITSEGYSGSIVGIGNVMDFSSSVDARFASIGGANGVISGSSQISALGFATTGSNTFNGNQIISGSLTIASGSSIYGIQQLSGAILLQPVEDPDPLSQTTTGTHLFVSSSNNQTGEDLYFRQIDNLVKWKWVEGKLNTGILSGGAISYSGSLVYVKAGTGIILSHNASLSDEISVTTNYVHWNDYTASCQNITSSLVTYLYVDSNGTIHQSDTYFTPTQYRTAIPIGMVNHTGKNVITSVANNVSTAYDDVSQTSDFIRAFGPMKLKGLSMTAATNSLKFTIEAGTSYILGGFYQQDPNNSSYKETSLIQTGSLAIARVRRDGSGGFIVDNNNGNFYNSIDPDYWDDGTGTLNTMASGDWQIQRVFFNPFTNRCHIYYGQNTYTTFINAKQYLATDSFVEAEYSSHQYVFIGYLIVKGQTNNLADDNNNLVVQSGLFRNTVGSSGGVQEFTHLHDLADVEVANPTNNDLLSYNSSNGLWEHHSFNELGLITTGSNALTGSQIVTGSLIVTGSVAGNVVALSVTSGTASIDFRRGTFFTLTIPSSTITHITASNMQPGLTANLVLTQQATTGSVRWDSGFKFPSGSFNTGSASGSAVDIVSMMMINTSQILSVGAKQIQ